MSNDPSPIIVCATDLSEASRGALDTAIELASRNRAARLHVLYVREVTERIETAEGVVERAEELKHELQREVDEEILFVKATRESLPPVETVTAIRHGKAYREILRYASEVKAELIVVGTHGRTGLGHAFLGSVAERIARHAACNVMVVKSPEVRAHLAQVLGTNPPY